MRFSSKLKERYDAKEQLIGPDAMRHHERIIMLSVLDQQWKDHLLSMDHLREGIGLRGYGQHDPLVEYKRESFDMFEAMMERFEEETVRYLYLMQVIEAPVQPARAAAVPARAAGMVMLSRSSAGPRNGSALATSIDDMEAEFQRRKRRELDQARMAGGDQQGSGAAGCAGRQGRPQRSLPLRQRQEIQEMLRGVSAR